MNPRAVASAASIAAMLALAAPASAAEPDALAPKQPCPDSFVPFLDPLNISGADQNGNGVVCAKTTGSGQDIFKDDKGNFFP